MIIREKTVPLACEIVSPRTVFDSARAISARIRTDEALERLDASHLDALRTAFNLAHYNQAFWPSNNPSDSLRNEFEHRLAKLAGHELAAEQHGFLPTIGVEVESPSKPFMNNHHFNLIDYKQLTYDLGLPHNIDNETADGYVPERWEFAPRPSYSAAVQARIISELMHSGLVPHLARTGEAANPQSIMRFLDDSLVSLHVNLGIPKEVTQKYDRTSLRESEDISLFVGSLVLAYASSLRLANKKREIIFDIKPAHSLDHAFDRLMRLEIKASEINDMRTYRMLTAAQAVGALLFADLGNGNPELASLWMEMKGLLKSLLRESGIYYVDFQSKTNFVKAATGETVSPTIRKILEEGAKQVRRLAHDAVPINALEEVLV